MTAKYGMVLAAAALLVGADVANAGSVQTVQLQNGENAGATRRDAEGNDLPLDQVFPGHEHSVARGAAGGVNVLTMSSSRNIPGIVRADGTDTREQLACYRVEFVDGVPTVTQSKHITDLLGDRYRNAMHPDAITLKAGDGSDVLFVTYNYAPNNDARRYGIVVNPETCDVISGNQVQLAASTNDDLCETEQGSSMGVAMDKGNGEYVTFQGCGGNGNGRDDNWIYANLVSAPNNQTATVTTGSQIVIDNQEERARTTALSATSASASAQGKARVATIFTSGNTQPPNNGVRATLVNIDANANIERVARSLIEEYDDFNPRVRSTQIRGHMTTENMIAATWQRVNNRRRRGPGRAQLVSAMLRVEEDRVAVVTVPETNALIGADATHMGQCYVNQGTVGNTTPMAFMVSTSINGNPDSIATAYFMAYNEGNRDMAPMARVGLNTNHDNAWLPNLYGNNPNTQGRNFTDCTTFANPDYGVAGGFQPDVAEFAIMAANPRLRRPDGIPEDKLALQLVFVPTVTEPGAETPVEPITPGPNPDDNGPTGPASAAGGCSAAGGSAGLGTLALLGLALFGARRRRRS